MSLSSVAAKRAVAPWQFEWKHPTWETIGATGDDDDDDDTRKTRGVPMAQCAAIVLASEVKDSGCCPANDAKDGAAAAVSGATTETDAEELLLTVTLLQQGVHQSDNDNHHRHFAAVADAVHIEILHRQQCTQALSSGTEPLAHTSNHQTTLLHSKLLQWPRTYRHVYKNHHHHNTTTTTIDAATATRNPTLDWHRPSALNDEGNTVCSFANGIPLLALFCGIPRLWRAETLLAAAAANAEPVVSSSSVSTTTRSTTTTTLVASSGIVAAALVRLPPPPDLHNDASRSAAAAADARDIVQLLALGGQSTTFAKDNGNATLPLVVVETTTESKLEQDKLQARHGADTNKHTLHSSSSTNTVLGASETTELLLVCLTNTGKVHFYSPWSLLQSSTRSGETLPNDTVDIMASYLFGKSLLTRVQENQLPLSQPSHSVSLSVPFLWQPHEAPPGNETRGATVTSSRGSVDQSSLFSSMWDASMWDPILDPRTLHHQTMDNVPTLCVAALEYICVAGHGRRRWTLNTTMDASKDQRGTTGAGGFLTLIALENFAAKRTLFLTFVPRNMSPFHWQGMTFLLVTGTTQAVAIRLDAKPPGDGGSVLHSSSQPPSVVGPTTILYDHEYEGRSTKKSGTNKVAERIDIQRFQLLPINLSSWDTDTSSIHRIVGCDMGVAPPSLAFLIHNKETNESSIVQRTLEAIFDPASTSQSQAHHLTTQYAGCRAVISTSHKCGSVAKMNLSQHDINEAWFHLGQGWCVLGTPKHIHFLCFEGSNSERGVFVQQLSGADTDSNYSGAAVAAVIPIDPFSIRLRMYENNDTHLPSVSNLYDQQNRSRENQDEIDDTILDAMESISRLSYRDSAEHQSPVRTKTRSFSLKEKSQKLKKYGTLGTNTHLSSRPSLVDCLTSVLSIRTKSNASYVLSFRGAAVASGPAAPFQHIVDWLSKHHDFFTAASLVLALQRDFDTLRHLWRSVDKLDDDEALSKVDGLIDGILPVYTDTNDTLEASLAQLADMTVGCLIQGGYVTSLTLEQFLIKSSKYDPSTASLMLIAEAARSLSDENELDVSPQLSDSICIEDTLDRILWPVRCLLKVGTARRRLGVVLLMLNTTIPEQLRRRDSHSLTSAKLSSMDVCKSLVSHIVASSSDALEMLLDLVDEQTRLRFWDSLAHDVRLHLSLISCGDKHPLLLDPEVRAWGLSELQKCVEHEDSASIANIYDLYPTKWLQSMIAACLKNAGCCQQLLVEPKWEETKEDERDASGLPQHRNEVQNVRRALLSSSSTGALDFGLVIPALLILEHREMEWLEGAGTSTRSFLNEVCYLAGRRNEMEPFFPLNGVIAMRQCTLLGNVEAGANLIGGRNGLILHCCRILIDAKNMSMEEAEIFLVAKDICLLPAARSRASGIFFIESCHRNILWLMEEHVLNIKTYGEFSTSRGKVDPVFAATVCFRTWLAITHHELRPATEWLMQWLRWRLSIVDTSSISPHRLVCATLIRALIWSEKLESTCAENLLANRLQLDSMFLIQLSRACCGLVEAIPDNMSESIICFNGKAETPTKVRLPHVPVTPAESMTSGALNETFVSAASSFGDTNTSFDSL